MLDFTLRHQKRDLGRIFLDAPLIPSNTKRTYHEELQYVESKTKGIIIGYDTNAHGFYLENSYINTKGARLL